MVARDGNAVEARHVRTRKLKNIRNQAHARGRRVDVGIADHKLLEDVVLYGAREVLQRDALFLRCHDVEGENGQDGAVHGHGDGHLIERYALKEALHVLDTVDGYAGFSYVALHARMVAVIATVCCKVKGNAEAHLARRQVGAVEGIGLFGG